MSCVIGHKDNEDFNYSDIIKLEHISTKSNLKKAHLKSRMDSTVNNDNHYTIRKLNGSVSFLHHCVIVFVN